MLRSHTTLVLICCVMFFVIVFLCCCNVVSLSFVCAYLCVLLPLFDSLAKGPKSVKLACHVTHFTDLQQKLRRKKQRQILQTKKDTLKLFDAKHYQEERTVLKRQHTRYYACVILELEELTKT